MALVNHIEAKKTLFVVAFICLVVHFEYVAAATFKVGDAGGWEFNVSSWPNGKTFKAGDILEFIYGQGAHNVVVVDKASYDSCKVPAGAKVYTSGDDHITLMKGWNYFICSFPGHCEGGMKIAVNAV